jgi:hypothetical protein
MGKIQYHQLSQSVHARNFKALLSALGERAENLPQLKPEISGTQRHLELPTAQALSSAPTMPAIGLKGNGRNRGM